ncbi:hypothetical protein M9458_029952, partial [Cirrhinus mrigala]
VKTLFAVILDHQLSFVDYDNCLGFVPFHFKENNAFPRLPLNSAPHFGRSHFTARLSQLNLSLPANCTCCNFAQIFT